MVEYRCKKEGAIRLQHDASQMETRAALQARSSLILLRLPIDDIFCLQCEAYHTIFFLGTPLIIAVI